MTMNASSIPQRAHSSFVLGDLKDFQERPLEMLHDIAQNYDPLIRIRFAHVPQYVVTDPEGIRYVLQKNNRNYIKEQEFMDIARTVLLSGDDLFTSDGDPWLFRRRLMQPAFHRRIVNGFSERIVQESVRLREQLQAGQTLDMEQSMMDVTMAIIGQTMLSKNILSDHPQLYEAFTAVSDHLIHRATTISGRFTPTFLPTQRNQQFKQHLSIIRETIGSVVRERQAQPEEKRPLDLLSMLMQGRDDESGFTLSTESLIDELFGIVTAGHETSSVALAWLFYEVAAHPEVEQKLLAEIDGVLNGRLPTADDLPHLPYTKMVVDEALRCYPSAYVSTRQAVAADEILGKPIPANSKVMLNIYGLHHHAGIWQHPEQFNPDRWRTDEINRNAFLPFGEGPRKCIGEPLARLEMVLIVATLLQKHRFRIAAGRSSTLVARFTLHSENGVWLEAVTR